ncbi:uncharacterized protein [Dermacentor andersoni]|uniref:uncharacterized protein n=1 Tax=Dermacentor andersoni TaxID=34620 RepID=UPI003B39FE9F
MAVLKTQNEAILNLLGSNRECEMDEQPVQTYPLRTVDEIGHLESNLKSSSSTRRQLCKVLGHIGGNTVRSTTANILKYLLHDSVAVMYSLHGQKGKRALAETELCRIILESVRKNAATASASDAEIRTGIMAWLKNAQARLDAAMKRCYVYSFTTPQGLLVAIVFV